MKSVILGYNRRGVLFTLQVHVYFLLPPPRAWMGTTLSLSFHTEIENRAVSYVVRNCLPSPLNILFHCVQPHFFIDILRCRVNIFTSLLVFPLSMRLIRVLLR